MYRFALDTSSKSFTQEYGFEASKSSPKSSISSVITGLNKIAFLTKLWLAPVKSPPSVKFISLKEALNLACNFNLFVRS